MRRGRIVAMVPGCTLAMILTAYSAAPRAANELASVASCPAAAQSSEIDAAQRAFAGNEQSVDLRLALAEALMARECYASAVHVLRQGESLHPRNRAIQLRLRYARSMLSEQQYIDSLAGAEVAARQQRNLLRCRKLSDLAACDALLREKPDQSELVIAKADALLASGRATEALLLYRRAAELDPKAAGIEARLSSAETQRAELFAKCQETNGQPALDACQLALIRGADDEFSIHQRKGLLLQAMDEPSKALDAYIAASLLKPDDPAVSHAILALTDSTGRNDALALAARGNALLALHRGAEAVEAFRGAQTLFPGIQGIEASLGAAEALAASEAEKLAEEESRRKAALAALREERVTVARLDLKQQPTFSNAAPAGRSH
jgi:tetratricopeptide (TPR) repeat protein